MAAGDRLGMQAKLSATTAKELPGTWWRLFPPPMNRLRGTCPVAQHGCRLLICGCHLVSFFQIISNASSRQKRSSCDAIKTVHTMCLLRSIRRALARNLSSEKKMAWKASEDALRGYKTLYAISQLRQHVFESTSMPNIVRKPRQRRVLRASERNRDPTRQPGTRLTHQQRCRIFTLSELSRWTAEAIAVAMQLPVRPSNRCLHRESKPPRSRWAESPPSPMRSGNA